MDSASHARPAEDAAPGDERKPYHPPTLTRWGDLAKLTRGGGGNKKEQPGQGGGGRTRF